MGGLLGGRCVGERKGGGGGNEMRVSVSKKYVRKIRNEAKDGETEDYI